MKKLVRAGTKAAKKVGSRAKQAVNAAYSKVRAQAFRSPNPLAFLTKLIIRLLTLLASTAKDIGGLAQAVGRITDKITSTQWRLKKQPHTKKSGKRINLGKFASSNFTSRVVLFSFFIATFFIHTSAGQPSNPTTEPPVTTNQQNVHMNTETTTPTHDAHKRARASPAVQLLIHDEPKGVPTTYDCPVIPKGVHPDPGLPCITLAGDEPARVTTRVLTASFQNSITLPLLYQPATNYYEQAEQQVGRLEEFAIKNWKVLSGLLVAMAFSKDSAVRSVVAIALAIFVIGAETSQIDVDIRDTLFRIEDALSSSSNIPLASPASLQHCILHSACDGCITTSATNCPFTASASCQFACSGVNYLSVTCPPKFHCSYTYPANTNQCSLTVNSVTYSATNCDGATLKGIDFTSQFNTGPYIGRRITLEIQYINMTANTPNAFANREPRSIPPEPMSSSASRNTFFLFTWITTLYNYARALSPGCIALSTHDVLTSGTTAWAEFTLTHGQCVTIKATGKPAISFTYVGADYNRSLIPDRAFILHAQVSAAEFHDRCPQKGEAVCPLDHSPNTVTKYTLSDRGWGNGCGLFAKGSVCGTLTLAPHLQEALIVHNIDYEKVDHMVEHSVADGTTSSETMMIPGTSTSDTELDYGVYGRAFIRCSPATTTKWINDKWTYFTSAEQEDNGWAIPAEAYRALDLPWMSLSADSTPTGNLLEPQRMIRWGTPRPNAIDYAVKEMGIGGLKQQFAKYPFYPLFGKTPVGVPDVLNCRVKTADLRWYGSEVQPCTDFPMVLQHEEHPAPDQNGYIHVLLEVTGLNGACRLTSKLTARNEDRAPLVGLQMGVDPIVTPDNTTAMISYRIPSGVHYLTIGQGSTAMKLTVENKRSALIGTITDATSVWKNFIQTSGTATPDDVAGGWMTKAGKVFGNWIRGIFHNSFGFSGVYADYAMALLILYISSKLSGYPMIAGYVVALLILVATYVTPCDAANPFEAAGRLGATLKDKTVNAFARGYYHETNRRADLIDPPGWIFPNCRVELAKAMGVIKQESLYFYGCFLALLALVMCMDHACDPAPQPRNADNLQNAPPPEPKIPATAVLSLVVLFACIVTYGACVNNTSQPTYSPDCLTTFAYLGLDYDVEHVRSYTIFSSLRVTVESQRAAWKLGIASPKYFSLVIMFIFYLATVVMTIGAGAMLFSRRGNKTIKIAYLITVIFIVLPTTLGHTDTQPEVNTTQAAKWSFDPHFTTDLSNSDIVYIFTRTLIILSIFFLVLSAPNFILRTFLFAFFCAYATCMAGHTDVASTMLQIAMPFLSDANTFTELAIAHGFAQPLAPLILQHNPSRLLTLAGLAVYSTITHASIQYAVLTGYYAATGLVPQAVVTAGLIFLHHHEALYAVVLAGGVYLIIKQAIGASSQVDCSWKASKALVPLFVVAALGCFLPTSYAEFLIVPIGLLAFFANVGDVYEVVVPKPGVIKRIDSTGSREYPYDTLELDEDGNFLGKKSQQPVTLALIAISAIAAIFVGPPAFITGGIVLSINRYRFTNSLLDWTSDDTAPTQNRTDGPVHVYKSFYGVWQRKVGAGYVHKGVLHVQQHVTHAADVLWCGTMWPPVSVNIRKDIVTYGGDYNLPTPAEGPATIIVIKNGQRYEESILLKKVGDNFIAPTTAMKPGDSGSVVMQDGQPVGMAGNMGIASGEPYTILPTVPPKISPTAEMYNACENNGCIVTGVYHCGAGKTRGIIQQLALHAKKRGRTVFIAVPTRVVANELKDSIGCSYVSQTSAFPSTCKGSTVHIICHATAYEVFLDRAGQTSGTWIVDESHFADERSQALVAHLKAMAREGTLSAIFLTATADDQSSDVSNFPIDDQRMTTTQASTFLQTVADKKVIIFTPTHSSKVATDLSKPFAEKITLNRSTFDANDSRARSATAAAIIATNIAEVGGNYNADIVVDLGQTVYPILDDDSHAVTLNTRPESRSSAIQRRGRVGRCKAGTCVTITEPGDYVRWPADCVSAIESDILLTLLGTPPSTGLNLEHGAPSRTQAQTIRDMMKQGFTTWYSYQAAMRDHKTASQTVSETSSGYTDPSGTVFTYFDQRCREQILRSLTEHKTFTGGFVVRRNYSATWWDTLASYTGGLFASARSEYDDFTPFVKPFFLAVVVLSLSLTSKGTISTVVTAITNAFTEVVKALLASDFSTIILPALYMFFGADIPISYGDVKTLDHTVIALAVGTFLLTMSKTTSKGTGTVGMLLITLIPQGFMLFSKTDILQNMTSPAPALAIPATYVSVNAIVAIYIYQWLGQSAYATKWLQTVLNRFDSTNNRGPVPTTNLYLGADWSVALGILFLCATHSFLTVLPGIALGAVFLLISSSDGAVKGVLTFLSGRDDISSEDLPSAPTLEARNQTVKVILAVYGFIGALITQSVWGLSCIYPITSSLLYKAGYIKEKRFTDIPTSVLVLAMASRDMTTVSMAIFFLACKEGLKYGDGDNARNRVIEQYNNWKTMLNSMSSFAFKNYKSAKVWERPSDQRIASRGSYKMDEFIRYDVHRPTGRVLDLACGAGGFSQMAVTQTAVKSAHGITLADPGHHTPRLPDLQTYGYNLFTWERGDIFDRSRDLSGYDTLYCDAGESNRNPDIETAFTERIIDRISEIFNARKPDAWVIKIHAGASDSILRKLRALQFSYGGGFHRSHFSRNSNIELYWTEYGTVSPEEAYLNLFHHLMHRARGSSPSVKVEPINLQTGTRLQHRIMTFRPPTERLAFLGVGDRPCLSQPYRVWTKWNDLRNVTPKGNSEVFNPLISALTKLFRLTIPGANDWTVTDTSAAAMDSLFKMKLDVDNVNRIPHIHEFRDIARHVSKTKPPPRILTNDEIKTTMRRDAAVGQLPTDKQFSTAGDALDDPEFWKLVDEEDALHATGRCKRGIFNTNSKIDKKPRKDNHPSRPASRMLAFLPLVERVLEQRYLGWINQDHWTSRERCGFGVGGLPIHYLPGAIAKACHIVRDYEVEEDIVCTDIAGWDTRIGADLLDMERDMLIEDCTAEHSIQIRTLYHIYTEPLIMKRTRGVAGTDYIEILQTQGQRMSGTIVTYTMNTITNGIINIHRLWSSVGRPNLDEWLADYHTIANHFFISGDDMVAIFPPGTNFAAHTSTIEDIGLYRKDKARGSPDTVLKHLDCVSFCSHSIRKVQVLYEDLWIAVKDEDEIIGKGGLVKGHISTPAIPALAKAMANYWLLIFPFQRDVRLLARTIRACVDRDVVPAGKVKDPFVIDQPWMTTANMLDVWNRIWITDNPHRRSKAIVHAWSDVPYLPQVEDIELGSIIGTTARAGWKRSMYTRVYGTRRLYNQTRCDDEGLNMLQATATTEW